MKARSTASSIADLQQAAAIQENLAHQRLALDWGQTLFGQLLRAWTQLETHETLAYEDKLRFQVDLLEDATVSLWDLHQAFVSTKRLLKKHQRQLQRYARWERLAMTNQRTSAAHNTSHPLR